MATRKELEDQMAAIQSQLDSAEDDDTELWIKNDKGNETRVPASKAGGWLKEQFGIDLSGAPAAGDGAAGGAGDGAGGGAGDGAGDPPPKGNGYFNKRKS